MDWHSSWDFRILVWTRNYVSGAHQWDHRVAIWNGKCHLWDKGIIYLLLLWMVTENRLRIGSVMETWGGVKHTLQEVSVGRLLR